jgi:hypothetical protein
MASIFFIIAVLHSCHLSRTVGHASYERVTQTQGGQSKDDGIKVGIGENMGALMFLGIGEGSLGINTNEVSVDPWAYNNSIKTAESKFKLLTGLQFIGKGYKSVNNVFNSTIKLNYLEIPVYAIYEHPVGTGYLFGGAGPYFAYGIGGKVKSGNFSMSSFGENTGGYKRFDMGLGMLGGYRMANGISIYLSYELGLANIAYSSQDFTAKNRAFGLNVSYDLTNVIHPNKKNK